MKATIEIPQRPILAAEAIVDGAENRRHPGPRHRWTPATLVAVLIIVVSSAALVSVLVGDGGGAQPVETAPASPPTTAVEAEPSDSSANRGVDRSALVVDVGDPAVDVGAETEEPSTTPPPEAPDTGGRSTIQPDGAQPSGPATDPSTIAPASPANALQAMRATSTTAGSSAGRTAVPAASPTTSSSTSTTTTPASGGGAVWEEHFDRLDTRRWEIEHSTYGDGNGERQCYQPQNVRVTDGRLVITARTETTTCPNGSTRTVTSGMVRSRGLTFSPGQAIEFRVKLTPPDPSNQAGLWPAVWASSWAGSWPRGGELDFLEVMTAEDPRRAVFSLHYADRSGGHELQNKAVPMSDYFSNGWHTVRFDYGRDGNLVWFLDGSRVFTVSAADTAQGYPAPFDQTIDEIKVNLAVGGRPGPLASGALGSPGATFEIDYIKVFDL
ncbi:MAG: family 16 glycosylhydrolase [Acidimicrobiia bacterium]|nr:family 16 glycosylhydrolase [Acidimicrobiia bacterium]